MARWISTQRSQACDARVTVTSSRGAPGEVAHAAHRVGAPAREAAAHARLQPHRRERHEREEARAHRVGALPREAAARARLQLTRRLGDDVLRHA